LLVAFDSEVRKTSVPQNEANFGIGTLAPDTIHRKEVEHGYARVHRRSGALSLVTAISAKPIPPRVCRRRRPSVATKWHLHGLGLPLLVRGPQSLPGDLLRRVPGSVRSERAAGDS